MTGDDTSREMGVEFGELAEDLEEEDYPISHDELVEKYGDREIDLSDGSETFGNLIGPVSQKEYENADDVRTMVQSMVGDEAVGRKGYSDRGSAPNEGGGESF